MPIYEYICPNCHQRFDTLSSIGQEEATCPNCGKTAERSHQITQVPAVKFKGPGFYVTDKHDVQLTKE